MVTIDYPTTLIMPPPLFILSYNDVDDNAVPTTLLLKVLLEIGCQQCHCLNNVIGNKTRI